MVIEIRATTERVARRRCSTSSLDFSFAVSQ